MKCYGKPGLIIQKREHTLGSDALCVKMINQTLQEALANHVHVGLICTSEMYGGIFKETAITNSAE